MPFLRRALWQLPAPQTRCCFLCDPTRDPNRLTVFVSITAIVWTTSLWPKKIFTFFFFKSRTICSEITIQFIIQPETCLHLRAYQVLYSHQTHHAPVTLVFFLVLEHSSLIPTSGVSYFLFSLPGMLFLGIALPFKPQLSHYLPRAVLSALFSFILFCTAFTVFIAIWNDLLPLCLPFNVVHRVLSLLLKSTG